MHANKFARAPCSPSLVAGLLVLLGFWGTARAALIAYDGFNYVRNQTVVGQGGGTGWNGSTYQINSGNSANSYIEESDMTTSFPTLGISGDQLHLNGTTAPGGNEGVYRNLATTYSTAGNIYWFSVLLQVDTSTGASYAGISLFSSNTEHFFYGQRNVSSFWGMEQHAGSGANSTVSAFNSANGLLVVELNGINHTASLYVNPTSLGGNAPTTANATLTFSDFSFDRIRAQTGIENLDVDELRFGTTFANVTPVPEPRTALLVLMTAALAARPRKRAWTWDSCLRPCFRRGLSFPALPRSD